MGPVLILSDELTLIVRPNKTRNPIFEKKSFFKAIEEGKKEINELKQQLSSQLSDKDLQIYDAHIEILGDPDLKEKTEQLIEEKWYQADFALDQVFKEYASLLQEMDDPYLKQRAQDIEMLSRMLILKIQGKKEESIELSYPSILVAENLTTNQFAALKSELILGIITSKGGKTDHLAIVAKALGIPTLVGVGDDLKKIQSDSFVILDSQRSLIYIDPDSKVVADYGQKKKELEEEKQQQLLGSSRRAITKSGKQIDIHANVGSFEDAQQAQHCRAEGIGLLRTEMFFLE
ncbi:MAG: phosphoenolpyruvate-utilizing N-terminal domain-containing protein, partial [Flavobacteriaceae bacterium]